MSLHQALLDNMVQPPPCNHKLQPLPLILLLLQVVQPEPGRVLSAQERLNLRNEYLRSIDEPSVCTRCCRGCCVTCDAGRLGMDLAVSLWDVALVLKGLLCMAESRLMHNTYARDAVMRHVSFRYLHSDVHQARLYWSEAKDLFFYCFIGSSGEILIADAPTPFLKKMMRIFTRCLRFLMCCEPE